MRNLRFAALTAVAGCLISAQARAGNQGSDLDISLTPAAGGMAGVGVVSPQDPIARQFGNPAALTQIQGDTEFAVGGALLLVDAHADHDGSITGVPFDEDSDATTYLLPEVGAQQRITDKLVIGGGIHAISGLGSDFRDVSPAVGPLVELVVFGANAGVAYDVTDDLTIGVSSTLGFGLLELGLVSNTGLTHTFGIRGSIGATYDLGPLQLGAVYNSPMRLEFDDVTETSPGNFSDFDLEQPQEVALGVATKDTLIKDLLLEFNFRWKNWSNAEGYQDVWQDQYIFALGGQYSPGPWAFRLGYSYSTDLQKDDVGSSIGNFRSLAVGGGTAPITPELVEFVQATLTQPYWQQQVTAGVGYELTEHVRVDAYAGYAFDGARTIGSTSLDVDEFQAGFGFGWRF